MSPGNSTLQKNTDMRLSVQHSALTCVSEFGFHQQQHFVSGYWASHQSPQFTDQICSPSMSPKKKKKKPHPLSLQGPVRCQVSTITLVNVGNDPVRRLNHLHRGLAKEFALVVNKLAPEATVGPDDGPPGLYPGVCLG